MKEKIEIQILGYHNVDGTFVYDFEEMKREFEREIAKLKEEEIFNISFEVKEKNKLKK